MSISVQGTIRIKRKNGTRGSFCVGDLETEIGAFKVKDAVLEQFDEGRRYTGRFWIQQIFSHVYTSAYGQIVIETRAKLADLQIDGEERAGTQVPEPQEPDPAMEAPPAAPPGSREAPRSTEPVPPSPNIAGSNAPAQSDEPPCGNEDEAADLALFGPDLYPLVAAREPVKLDPTIERFQFRKQRERLREELHYGFKSIPQIWYPPGHPALLQP